MVGYWSSGKHGLSSLLLGCFARAADARSGHPLRFCGKVGTGFDERERARLQEALDRHARRTPPCAGVVPQDDGIVWCKPRLVVQIRFTEWTHEGALRHPVFAGARSDKQVHEVIHREALASSPTAHRGGPHGAASYGLR